jgi:multidrug resistance efflux pump
MGNDAFRPSLFGMSVTGIALAIWVGWFALARVPLTETTTDAQFQRDGTVLAHFQPEQIGRVKPGQDATVHVPYGNAKSPAQNFTARVSEVANSAFNRLPANTALLYLQTNELPQGALQVEITVEQVPPLVFILNAGQALAGTGRGN